MDSHTFLQILVIALCTLLFVTAENAIENDPALDYELSPAAAEFYRQARASYGSNVPQGARRLPWNMMIRPGMAGGFRKRVSEREINNMLKGTWLG